MDALIALGQSDLSPTFNTTPEDVQELFLILRRFPAPAPIGAEVRRLAGWGGGHRATADLTGLPADLVKWWRIDLS